MATSLAEQLNRLATPQTSALLEKKSRASILYDPKKAAEIDRQTIFDEGKSGLEELINLNSAFRQFQNTLFDDSTINFERSVETSDVNKTLDRNIRKFLLHLSPYFPVRAAHNCLEWLIRRHRIHEYNVDDMMALILPYHETMMFVKCLQIIPLKNKSQWKWMEAIQKPGVPLSKQAIINRAASDPFFLQFISKTTLAAVKELNGRAHTLQACFAFYSTITLGALSIVKEISDSHMSNIGSTLLRGLSSDVIDFCAASMIITAFLLTKIQLADIFLKRIIEKAATNISRPELRRDSIVLLMIIFQTQNECTETAAEIFFAQNIDNKLVAVAFGGLYKDNINVISLCLPLIRKCLGQCDNKKNARRYHQFVEMLLQELTLKNDDANAVIRCILNAMKRTPKPQSDIIDLNSDDEDVDMKDGETDASQWPASLMRILETRYSEVFDAVKTDIMSSRDEESCSLKIVLGALLCSTYNADPSGASVFVDLYHPSAQNRKQAVEALVNMNKLSTMPFSDDKKNLLVTGIAQRLSDDSPDVVNEVLKFKTEDLIKIIGEANLIKKLKSIIGNEFMAQKKWQNVIGSAVKHITSKHLLSESNEIEIFLAILPYTFSVNETAFDHSKAIIKSGIASRFPIVKQLQACKHNSENHLDAVNKLLQNSFDESKVNEIVQFIKTTPEAEMSTMSAFHVINLLTHVLMKNSNHNLSTAVFDVVMKLSQRFDVRPIDINQYVQELYGKNRPEKLSVQLIEQCVRAIIEKTNFSAVVSSKTIDFTLATDELCLVLKIHDHICRGLFNKLTNSFYNRVMSRFVRILLPSIEKQLDFFSNFFIVHHIDRLASMRIGAEVQLRSIRILNELLTHANSLKDLTMEVFVRIISGLTSPFEAIRLLTIDTIDKLHALLDQSSEYSKFFGLILREKEKVCMSPEELSLFLFQTKLKRTDLFRFIQRPDTAMVLKASSLNMLQLVNDDKLDTMYLKIVIDVALDILKRIDGTQITVLGPLESIVVYHAIIRFNSENISSISKPGNYRTFFEFVLQQSNVYVEDIDNKLQSISVVAMNLNMFNDFPKFNVNQQKFIVESIVKATTFAKQNDVRTRASKFFRKTVELDGKIEINILTKMVQVTSIDAAKRKGVKCLSQDLLQTPEWKCGVTLLEFLHRKRLKNPLHLIRQLFPVLQKCLDFDDQSMVEYAKQLVLNDILNCCSLLPSTVEFQESDFKIELVVQCVRGTQNPQTHHHALQLLTELATRIPESVLHHIMEIFTFVGCTVVRRDDDYIYQLISNVIKSVVPILKENNIIQVLRAFSVIIIDVPTHRRLALYEDLLKTLGPREYLWMFMAIVFEKDVRQMDGLYKEKTAIVVEITNLFDCEIILRTCHRLIKFLRSQLNAKVKRSEIADDLKAIFNPEHYDVKETVRYMNLMLNYINTLTMERSEFASKMASLDQASLLQHKETFKNIIPSILKFIKELIQLNVRSQYGLSACYGILDHLLDLLYPDMLLKVVNSLLDDENDAEVRRKIVDLLNKKLDSPNVFDDCKDSVLALLEPITKIVDTINETPTSTPLQEYALASIELMSKVIAKDHPNEFGEPLKILSKILKCHTELSIRLRVIKCLGEMCGNLRIHTVSHLHKFMPSITNVLNDLLACHIDAISSGSDMILKAICRIVETVPRFLTPFLVDLITSLSILWSRLQDTSSTDSQKNLLKLDEIWRTLSSSLELRVLIPMVEKHIYPDLLKQGQFVATGPLMVLLLDSFGNSEQADLVQNCQDLTTFFIGVMDFRSKFHRDCKTVDVQEDFFVKTLIGFVLKLSEGSFRPFYNKLHEWSKETSGKSYDRDITFYRLSNKIAESLKSLFNTFYAPIVQSSADLLKKSFTETEINLSSAKPATLIYNILSTLKTVFLYGNSFINSQRFNVLMEPLVNLLDYEEYVTDERISAILPKCFAQFAVAANNDLLWKQLNHQILKKTKSNNVVLKRCALLCSVEVVIQLGDDSTQLYPELIPFFSELLEDDDPEIQKICNKCIIDIEKVTGEELKKHL